LQWPAPVPEFKTRWQKPNNPGRERTNDIATFRWKFNRRVMKGDAALSAIQVAVALSSSRRAVRTVNPDRMVDPLTGVVCRAGRNRCW